MYYYTKQDLTIRATRACSRIEVTVTADRWSRGGWVQDPAPAVLPPAILGVAILGQSILGLVSLGLMIPALAIWRRTAAVRMQRPVPPVLECGHHMSHHCYRYAPWTAPQLTPFSASIAARRRCCSRSVHATCASRSVVSLICRAWMRSLGESVAAAANERSCRFASSSLPTPHTSARDAEREDSGGASAPRERRTSFRLSRSRSRDSPASSSSPLTSCPHATRSAASPLPSASESRSLALSSLTLSCSSRTVCTLPSPSVSSSIAVPVASVNGSTVPKTYS
mmetsp:Transcript_13051/g.29792  ORF Transcript_13051/g.29792 Transcript_13051/m.29792 type:complete len:282 (+) Transcript_13051:29-874(+)